MGYEGGDEPSERKLKKHYALQLALYTDILRRLNYSTGFIGKIWDSRNKVVEYDLSKAQSSKNAETWWADQSSNNFESIFNGAISRYQYALFQLLANQIYRKNIMNMITYFFGEMAANFREHSQAGSFWLFSQYYSSESELEICLCDTGVGLRGSYQNCGIEVSDDYQALSNALQGFSSKKGNIRGYGIRTCLALATRSALQGEFMLVSGNIGALYRFEHEPISISFEPTAWNGVIIYMRTKKPKTAIDIYRYVE